VDLYSLIKQDHEAIAGLFRRLQAAEGFTETAEQLFAQLREEFELHAYAAEQVLYPALRAAEGAPALVQRARDNHALIQTLLDELAVLHMDDTTWYEKLGGLAEYAKAHIEAEEGDIFNVARQRLSAAQTTALTQHWQAAKQEHMARHAK